MQNSLMSFFNSRLIFGDTVEYFDHDNLLCQMKEREKSIILFECLIYVKYIASEKV